MSVPIFQTVSLDDQAGNEFPRQYEGLGGAANMITVVFIFLENFAISARREIVVNKRP